MHRVKTREEWEQLVHQCKELGVSQKSFCDQKGLKLSTFSYWCRKLRQSSNTTITCVELPNIGTYIPDEVLDIQIQSEEIQIPLSNESSSVKIQGNISLAALTRIVRACSGKTDV